MRRKTNILTVCHDAGGAELVASYLHANRTKYVLHAYTAGPASKIFKKYNLPHTPTRQRVSWDRICKSYGRHVSLLASVGWSTDYELQAICAAKKLHIRTIAYLDHWINFRERFGYPAAGWKRNMPDEIWVGDRYALAIAKKAFRGMRVRLVANQYLKHVKATCKRKKAGAGQNHILFVAEPITKPVNSFGDPSPLTYSEIKIADHVIEAVGNCAGYECIIRPHPAEPDGKYDAIVKKHARHTMVRVTRNSDLLKDVAWADTVIGIDSMALAVACMCGKKVVSFIPDRSYRPTVPFAQIKRIYTAQELQKILK